MSDKIQAIRGMHDILPTEMPYWHRIEGTCREVVAQYGYAEIRTPLLEQTRLFKRGIGDVTDIVEKEMYTFDDRNGDSLTLRPEGTASCVRAGIEHGLLYNQIQRLWYMGPMFRHERPQKGRQRQFHQLGVEAFGMLTSAIDLEMILLSKRILEALGLAQDIKLQINNLGSRDDREQYKKILIDYFTAHEDKLDDDSRRRLLKNPLRILDSKNPEMIALNENAPKLTDFINDRVGCSRDHFARLTESLDNLGVSYEINPRLVRGLDYYGLTVFEWVTTALGAQGTVCAGGRYDGLVEQLGGKATPAIGFAMGIERIALLLQEKEKLLVAPDYYVVSDFSAKAFSIIESIRTQLPQKKIEMDLVETGNPLKRADKSGAHYALIIRDEEILMKNLKTGEQKQVLIPELVMFEQK